MDPNETLSRLREIVEWLKDGNADGSDLERAVHYFDALDTWLTEGGFLPDAWAGPGTGRV